MHTYNIQVEQFTGAALTGEEPGWYTYARTKRGYMQLLPGEWDNENDAMIFAADLNRLDQRTLAVLLGD